MTFAAAFLLSTFVAGDWPQFLGPTRDGVYSSNDIAATFPASGPPIIWKKDVGEGFASPVVASGKVILFHRVSGRELIEALDAATGKNVWSYEYPTTYRDDFGFDEGPRSAPVVADGVVYAFGAEGMLSAVDLATGKKKWMIAAMQKYGVKKGWFGAAGSPLVEGGRVIVNLGGQNAGIVAFDTATGALAWKATNDEASYSSGTVATIGGERHAIFLTRAGVVDLNPATGQVRFSMPFRSRNNASVNAATPLVIGNLVFVSASYNTGAALLEVSGSQFKKLWANDDSMSNHYSTCVFRDGFLYGFHGRQEYGQSLRSIELKTGKVMWDVDGFGAGTVTLIGDRLLIVRENGQMVVAPASPKAYQSSPQVPIIKGVVRAYPALSDGRIYLRNEHTLICARISR
ncbi:MAG TPA: PQQ-binding-like beta-propeller repeat protein [Bryobacteraceae bacterium]|jgi:outer membrane protein assembly factor BamB|nr:PQQ-binding-like beta-propeller repeat protein [Bryobacteraceae bacterium]